MQAVNDAFEGKSREETYQEILKWGEKLPPFNEEWKCEDNRVEGCQSLLYLHVEMIDGTLLFFAHSDALISRGLAALLITHYNGMTPQELFKQEPTFLEELGIISSLSPTRANGVASLWLKMKRETVLLLAKTQAATADRSH